MEVKSDSQVHASHWPLTILMGLASIFQLILPLFLVRILSAEEIGIYKKTFLYVMTAPWFLLSSGFTNGLYYWSGQVKARTQAFAATLTLLLYWAAATLAIGLAGVILAGLFGAVDRTTLFVSACGVAAIAFTIPSQFIEDLRITGGRTLWAGAYGAIWDVTRSAVMIAFAAVFRSIEAIIFGFMIYSLARFALSLFLNRLADEVPISFRLNSSAPAVWSYAWPASLSAFAFGILVACDQFLLSHSLTAAEFAIYSIGCLSVPPLFIFEQSVNKVMIPKIGRLLDDERYGTAHALAHFKRSIVDLAFVLVPASVGLAFFARPIILILFTGKFAASIPFLQVYSLSYLMLIFPFDAWARAKGDSRWIMKTVAVFAVAALALTAGGLGWFGPLGALAGFLTAHYALRAYALHKISGWLNRPWGDVFPAVPVGAFLAVSLILGFASSLVFRQFGDQTGPQLAATATTGAAFTAVYLALCWPLKLRWDRRLNPSRKILILTQYLNVGGLERMILGLSRELARRDSYQPVIFVYDRVANTPLLDAEFGTIPVIRKQKKSGVDLRISFALLKACLSDDIDCVHTHDLGPLVYAVIAKILSLGRIRIIYTKHGSLRANKPSYIRLERMLARFTSAFVCVSEPLKEQTAFDGLDPARLTVIENGIPFPKASLNALEKREAKANLARELGRPHERLEDRIWLINLARLHRGKGQEHLLAIWKQIPPETRSHALLLFVGGETQPGYFEKILADSRLRPETDGIVFAGGTTQPDRWLSACDALVSASEHEGLPLSPLEAAAMLIPSLLSDIPGHQALNEIAEFFPLGDPITSAMVIGNFIVACKTENQFKRLDAVAIEKWLIPYGVDRMTERYEAVYDSLA